MWSWSFRYAYNITNTPEDHCSLEQIYFDFLIFPPEEHLRVIRLNYLSRFIHHAPLPLKHLVNLEYQLDHECSSCLSRLYNDLDIVVQPRNACGMPPPTHEPVVWHDRITDDPDYIKLLYSHYRTNCVFLKPVHQSPVKVNPDGQILCPIC